MAEPTRRAPELFAWGAAVAVLLFLFFMPDLLTRLRAASGDPYVEAAETCDPRVAECEAAFPDGVTVHLRAAAGPRASDPIQYEVHVHGAATARSITVQGARMNMGVWSTPLVAGDPGRWTASGALPLCTLERMEWQVIVELEGRSAGFTMVTAP